MTDVLKATYADLKTVKTRGVCQIVLEMPIEGMADAFSLLGAPIPGNEVWVAVARLRDNAEPQQIEHANDEGKPARPLSQQAGYLCNILSFRRWLEATGEGDKIVGVDEAAIEVRRRCGVASRSELDRSDEAARIFRDMRADYDNWMHGRAA